MIGEHRKMLTIKKAASLCMVILIITCLLQSTQAVARDINVIAVLPFENSSGLEKLEPLEKGLRDIIMGDLAETEGIAVVERENLDKVVKELEINLLGLIDSKTQIKVGKLVGANIMLVGGFSLVDSTMKINAHLLDIETTELIKSEEVKGKVTDIVQLSRELTLKLLKDLDIKIDLLPRLNIDQSPEANLHFIRGLGYYYGCMYDHAIMEFMYTMNLNPGHTDARFWNANSYFVQEAWSHAKIELDRFLKEFPQDPRTEEVKEMNKTCWENMKDWERKLFESTKR